MSYLAVWLPQLPWQALRFQGELPAGPQLVLEAAGLTRQVVAVNPAALRRGLSAGLSEAQARLRAPEALAVARSPAAERQLQAWMQEDLEHSSDRCHWLPPERWLLDLEGMGLLGSPAQIARTLRARLRARGLQPALGVAATRTAALLAASGGGLWVIADPDPAPALAALPLEALRALQGCGMVGAGPSAPAARVPLVSRPAVTARGGVLAPTRGPHGPKSALRLAGAAPNSLPGGGPPCGITTTPEPEAGSGDPGSQPFAPILPAGKAARPPRADAEALLDLFARWGLRSLGEVAALPPRALAERLGRAGLACQRWARGQDQGLLLPAPPPEPPCELRQEFEPALEGYLPLLPWLEQKLGQHCAALERADRALAAAALELGLQSGSPWRWEQRWTLPHRDARRLLRQLETSLAMQPPAAPIAAATLRLVGAKPRRTQTGLFGDPAGQSQRLGRLLARLRELLDDPEGQRCGAARLQDLHRDDAFVVVPYQPSGSDASDAYEVAAPAPPEAVPCLRVARPPARIQLELRRLPAPDGVARPEGALCHLPRRPPERVLRAAGPWRSSGEWWTDGAWSRDEWDVELAHQQRFRLLYDRRARAWFLLGEYD
ncbi:MAG TPA: hypothetical protein VMV31_07885 [Terriglobales bacterium]|nr:hypothetical protein [Terriglobales bacterium]